MFKSLNLDNNYVFCAFLTKALRNTQISYQCSKHQGIKGVHAPMLTVYLATYGNTGNVRSHPTTKYFLHEIELRLESSHDSCIRNLDKSDKNFRSFTLFYFQILV